MISTQDKRVYFAGVALQALIAKLPLHDEENELGQGISTEDMVQLKKDVAYSAWRYADFMLEMADFKVEFEDLPL